MLSWTKLVEVKGLRSKWGLDIYQPEMDRFAGDLPAKRRKNRIELRYFNSLFEFSL